MKDKIKFFDMIESDSNGFTLTTEDPSVLNKWTQKILPDKSCAIAGGGESILLGVLPYSKEVIGVDVSCNSLRN